MAVQHIEVTLKSLSDRLDVTYYLVKTEVKKYLSTKTGIPLRDLCTPIRTKTPPREVYVAEGTPCLKLRNVTGRMLNITNCSFIPERLKAEFVTAKKYDILLTATGEGTAGRVDIFLEPNTYVVTGENILLRPNLKRINPFYLLAILRTEIIAKQLTHFVRGATGQTHLYWRDIADIYIPEAHSNIQQECEKAFQKAWAKRCLVAEKIHTAKNLVTEATGIEKVDVHQRSLTFETTFTKVHSSLRFDVEYYQPIHYTIQNVLQKANCIQLSTVAKLNKSMINPKKFPADTYHYVDISSIDTEIGDYELAAFYGYEAPTRARRRPKKGDLIVSTVRPNRNAIAVIEEQPGNLVVSTGFAVITPTAINPLVLYAVLKAEPIYAQIVRKATAAMYPAVTGEDIMDIFIPKLSDRQANQIEQCIKESIKLREQSDALLEEFKRHAEYVLKRL